MHVKKINPHRATRPHFLRTPVLWALAVQIGVIGTTQAQVQQAASTAAKPDDPSLPVVTVSGTRTENKIEEAPATVSVIGAKEIENRLVQDIRDLTRYEPNVSVANSPTRFGLTGINIRGIEGNRILMQVDGVRLPDSFSIGSFSFATRNSIDVDMLKSVEILRGPGSSLYGSDALGGVVSFYTKDPLDLLSETKENYYLAARQSYAFANTGTNTSATIAGGKDWPVQVLLHANYRDANETRNFGLDGTRSGTRTAANPQGSNSTGLLAKLVWDTGGPLLRFTVDSNDDSTQTDVATLNSLTPKTSLLTADDHARRTRFSVDAEWGKLGFVDALKLNAYDQESETRQRTLERRDLTTAGCSGVTTGTNTCLRDVEFSFYQKIYGAGVQGESRFGNAGGAGSAMSHRITYGADFSRTTFDQTRDGIQTLITAAGVTTTTKSVGADVFPVHDFPSSKLTQTGFYLQDEILLADGKLSIVPGVRYDRFKLDPTADDIFVADNPGVAVKALDDQAVSPRIAVLWKVLPQLALYAQAAKGFRAPPYSDVNLGFTNFAFGYTAIPNPDLKAEKSQGYELGLRGSGAMYSYSVTYFSNRYRDFISSLSQLNCPGDPRCSTLVPITFQSINIGRVKINGAEARGDVNLDSVTRGLKIIGSIGITRGENEVDHVPLDSVDPRKTVLGIKYDAPSKYFGVEAIGTFYAQKDRLPVATQFAPPSANIFDLLAYVNFARNVQFNIGIFNVGDRKYWLWTDVRGITAASTIKDRFTQPGRNLAASVKVTF